MKLIKGFLYLWRKMKKDETTGHVPVYTNGPISRREVDYLGLDPYARHISTALEKCNTIGIIGDFGTGKSSLIEYLKSYYLKDEYEVASINMWKVNSKEKETDSIDLHIQFLYQLALEITKKGFSRRVNRRLNRNYGLLSFDANRLSKLLFAVMVVLYLVYAFIKPDNTSVMNCIFEGKLPGIVLVLSIVSGMVGIVMSSITVSSGKNENKREINANEIVEQYKEILAEAKLSKYCLCKKNKKLVIVIEDLDRSTDNKLVIDFLEELNRYYINSLDSEELKRIKFIVNIRPENEIIKNSEQHKGEHHERKGDGKELPGIEEKQSETLDDLSETYAADAERHQSIYSKIFEYTVDLFPISVSSYDVLLDDLLNEQKDNLKDIGINIYDRNNSRNIPGMKRLIFGRNLTLRDIKERLNCALMIYSSLYHNQTDSEKRKNIVFEKCAFVAYLKNTYPKQFARLYDNQQFEKALMEYVVKHNEDENTNLAKSLEEIFSAVEDKDFIKDLIDGIKDKQIDTDFKMYFYNYPKNAYIKSLSEAIVYDAIMYDEYNDSFDESLNEALLADKSIISNTYDDRLCISKRLPLVTFKNGYLFEHCIINCRKNTFDTLAEVIDFKNNPNESIELLKKLFSLEFKTFSWSRISDYADDFKSLFSLRLKAASGDNTIYDVRGVVLEHFAEQICCFDYLFSDEFPAVNGEEFKKIPDLNTGLEISLIQPVELATIKTITQVVLDNYLDKKTLDLTIQLYDRASEEILDDIELGKAFVEFSENTGRISIKMEEYIYGLAKEESEFIESYKSALNSTNGKGLEQDTLINHIVELDIKTGLSISFIVNVLKEKENQLFTSNLLSANYCIEDLINYEEQIKEGVDNLYFEGERKQVFDLRKRIIQALRQYPLIQMFRFLFIDPFAIITQDELNSVQRIKDALALIDVAQINLDNMSYISKYINSKEPKQSSIVYQIFKMIKSVDAGIAEELFYQLDFSKIKYSAPSRKNRNDFIEFIEEDFDLVTNKTKIIEFLSHIKFLEKVLEKRLLGGLESDEFSNYSKLLNGINAEYIDETTINVLESSGIYGRHNKQVQGKLLEYKQYERYVYAKTMTENTFTFEKDQLDCFGEAYKSLFVSKGISLIQPIMIANEEFRDYAINERLYLEVKEKTFLLFAKGEQTEGLIDSLFTKDDEVIEAYLCEVKSFDKNVAKNTLFPNLKEKPNLLVKEKLYKSLLKSFDDTATKNQLRRIKTFCREKVNNIH